MAKNGQNGQQLYICEQKTYQINYFNVKYNFSKDFKTAADLKIARICQKWPKMA